MSPRLLIAFILKVAVAVNLDDLSPAAQAKLEAAILAKYNVNVNDQTKQSSNINGPAPSEPTEAQGFSLKDAPFEVADLETAVLAKYSMEKHSPADWQTSSSPQQLDEAAVLEKWKREDSGLNVRNLEDSSKEASSDEALIEKWKREDSGLNVRKLEDSSKEASSDEALIEKWKREDSSQQTSSGSEAGVQSEAPQETSSSEPATSSKLILKKPSNESAADEVTAPMNSSSEASAPEVASSSNDTAAQASKPKTGASKHYRNHGAGIYHVEEPAKPVKRLADQADNAESAAKLAAKRAEVEEIFHLSKQKKQGLQDAQEAPASAVYSLLRCSFFLAAVLSIAGFAWHKYQVILEISNRKGDNLFKRSFKAKQEDDDPWAKMA